MSEKEKSRHAKEVESPRCACPECSVVVPAGDWDGLQMCTMCREDPICLRETVRFLRGIIMRTTETRR